MPVAEYTATAESRPPSESGSSIAEEVVEEAEFLFVFQLRSFPSLDKYRQDDTPPMSYTVHTMINERIDALLKERYSFIYLSFVKGNLCLHMMVIFKNMVTNFSLAKETVKY